MTTVSEKIAALRPKLDTIAAERDVRRLLYFRNNDFDKVWRRHPTHPEVREFARELDTLLISLTAN